MYSVVINPLPHNLTESIDLVNAMNAWCKERTEDKRFSYWQFSDFKEGGILYRFEDEGMAVLFSLKWVK